MGAFINSIILTIGLLYLLLLRWKDLIAIFINKPADLQPVRLSFLKPVLKLLAIAAAFGTIYSYVAKQPPSIFAGKWKVQDFIRNGKLVDKNNWLINPNSWCNIYIEESGDVYMSANPYVFDEESVRKAEYKYDSKTHIMKLIICSC